MWLTTAVLFGLVAVLLLGWSPFVLVGAVLGLTLFVGFVGQQVGLGLFGWLLVIVYSSVGALAVLLCCLLVVREVGGSIRVGTGRVLAGLAGSTALAALLPAGVQSMEDCSGMGGCGSVVPGLAHVVFGEGLGLVLLVLVLLVLVLVWSLLLFSDRVDLVRGARGGRAG